MVTTLLLAVAALVPAAGAEPSPGLDAACEALHAGADAERALLLAPELFARFGMMSLVDEDLGAPALRASAGLEYSLSRVRRGLGVGDRAGAACRRAQAEARLGVAIETGEALARRAAAAARARVLEALLPEGERIVADVERQVRNAAATLDELDAARLRLDALRALAAESSTSVGAAAPAGADPAEATLPVLLADWRAADVDVARAEGRLRGSGAWDVSLRGGYDQILDGRADVPLFAMVSFSYNLGELSRRRAEARALAARGRASGATEALVARAERTATELAALRSVERARLAQIATLRRDLRGQLVTVQALATSEVRRYRNNLWFEVAKLDAEEAWLSAHVAELDRLLGEPHGS